MYHNKTCGANTSAFRRAVSEDEWKDSHGTSNENWS